MTTATARKIAPSTPSAPQAQVSPAQQPKAIFKTTMYALTRPGADGRIEFATSLNTWTRTITEAHMFGSADPIPYVHAAQMKEKGATISRIAMSVYEEGSRVPPPKHAWDREDAIVVARQTNCHGDTIERAAPLFITNVGSIGRGNEVSAHIQYAVPIDLTRDWNEVRQAMTQGIKVPNDRRGIWLDPRRYAYSRTKRVIHIEPAVAG